MTLPGWEDEDTGEVVVVPAYLFFAEESYDSIVIRRGGEVLVIGVGGSSDCGRRGRLD